MSVTLFENKQDCCGCGACKNVCPRDAISMVADEDGFAYPQIDAQRCVKCGACKKACGYQNPSSRSRPIVCYAAAAKDTALLKKSASGGVFAVMAKEVLGNGGVVYGVAMSMENGGLTARHIRIDSIEGLNALQGSKYVQSDTGKTYSDAKKDIFAGRQVLYSGTPCQIAGLLSYLGKEYENLLTMEVICHGVPNGRMFRDFLKTLEEQKCKSVTGFSFRTKNRGQGKNVCVEYCGTDGVTSKRTCDGNQYSYVYFFQKALVFRSSCYSCKFAAAERTADITVGDYWGFHEEYPIVRSDSGLSNATGVSCVLLNSEKGVRYFEKCSSVLSILETEFEKVAKHNMQLRVPCRKQPEREVILRLYREQGYRAVEQHFHKTCWKNRVVSMAMEMVPMGLKRAVKRAKGLLRKN